MPPIGRRFREKPGEMDRPVGKENFPLRILLEIGVKPGYFVDIYGDGIYFVRKYKLNKQVMKQ